MRLFLLGLVSFAPFACASTINGTVSGTCGFYEGVVSNVVFSQSFSGNGTFCTGFLPGGSVTETSALQLGDIFTSSSQNTEASAPAGYGVFVDFSTTLQATQEYLIDTAALPNQPTTPTGSLSVFLGNSGGTDDGTGMGSCHVSANVNIGGHNSSLENGTQFLLPITFGQPFTATETASATCNEYGASWGDDGFLTSSAAPLLVEDANGNILGSATLLTIPEPGTGALMFAVLAICCLFWLPVRRRMQIFMARRVQIGEPVLRPRSVSGS